MATCSTVFYHTVDHVPKSLELPTIQNIQIPDTSTIPSRPTITGEYRNQFVSSAPRKVNFIMWLENGVFGSITLDVKTILDQLTYLRDHRIKFNLTTTKALINGQTTESEESAFLSDLVVENFTLERDASRRFRLVCRVNCTQIKLIDLKWKQASSVEIFGTNIFTNETEQNLKNDFIAVMMGDEFPIDPSWWAQLKSMDTELASGKKNLPVAEQIMRQLEGKITFADNYFFMKLGSAIDLADGTKTYNCKNAFQSTYGLGSSGTAYNVSMFDLVVKATQNEGILEPNYTVKTATGGTLSKFMDAYLLINPVAKSAMNLASDNFTNQSNTIRLPYDTADTYPDYNISKTFEKIEPMSSLAEYLVKHKDAFNMDKDTIRNTGTVIVDKNGYVNTYKISQRYSYTVSIGDTFKKPMKPDGGLKIDTFDITTSSNNFKPIVSNSGLQGKWDDKAYNNYKVTLAFITLGTLLQIYVFSDQLFTEDKINLNG